jgi:alpha-tubulin suppressor-like RCC1 family protein
MPTFYNFTENGVAYSFDDVFIPADFFREGNLFVWGSNANAQLGTNDIINKSTPVTTLTGGANWKQISSRSGNTAAIKTDGTLWIWGNNATAQLGTNSTTNASTPVTTFVGGTDWKQVSTGYSHCAAIKTDGTLWVWGNNALVQLGINATTNRSTPVTTFAGGTNWKQVSCGANYTAAIKTDGTLWSWGAADNSGRIGTNDLINKSTPVTTFAGGTNWKQVSVRATHTAAVKTDGTLWSWGYNTFGRLGNNTTTQSLTPVTTFAGGTNWKQVDVGHVYCTAVKTDGTLWGWGPNTFGELGNNTTTQSLTPVTTFAGGTNWKQVACGGAFNAAIKTDGTLWTWGSNTSGAQLGVNDTTNRLTPVTTFAGGTIWKEVSCGYSNTRATTYIDSVI